MVQTIINNVEELCKLRGISLHEVSQKLGVADGYLKRERDDFPLSKVIKLASILAVEPQQLWDKGFTQEVKKMAIDAEIERLKKAREALDHPGENMTPPDGWKTYIDGKKDK